MRHTQLPRHSLYLSESHLDILALDTYCMLSNCSAKLGGGESHLPLNCLALALEPLRRVRFWHRPLWSPSYEKKSIFGATLGIPRTGVFLVQLSDLHSRPKFCDNPSLGATLGATLGIGGTCQNCSAQILGAFFWGVWVGPHAPAWGFHDELCQSVLSGPKRTRQQDSTRFSPPNNRAIFSKKVENPLDKFQSIPVETAPRNCRFLSLVVVGCVLILICRKIVENCRDILRVVVILSDTVYHVHP